MNVSLLSQTYIQKLEVIKDLIFKIGQLNLKTTDSIFLTGLRRLIKQQESNKQYLITRKPDELHKCFCYNNSKLTWDEAFDLILDIENFMVLHKPLSCQQLKDIATLFSENIMITFEEIKCSMINDAVHQILRIAPYSMH